MKLIINIQMLRAFAALFVVVYHLAPRINIEKDYSIKFIIDFFGEVGYAGVDVFFVISGYVMWLTSQKMGQSPSVSHFIYNRLTRIFFGYWPYFFITLLVIYVFMPDRLSDIDLMGSFFLTQIRIDLLVLQVAWTLTYELYFYICFAFLLFLPRHYLPKVIGLLMLFVVVVQSYSIAVNDMYHPERFPYNSYFVLFFTSPFCLEFLAGCLLGYFFETQRLKKLGLWVVLALCFFALGYYYQKTQLLPTASMAQGYFLPQRIFFWGGTALITVAIFIELNLRNVIFKPEMAKLFGGASYSIYLSHIPMIYLLRKSGLFDWFPERSIGIGSLVLLVVGLVLIYSLLHYALIEKPLMRMSKKVGRLIWKD